MSRTILYIAVLLLISTSTAMAFLRYVPLKMLSFDNKNEFQIILDMQEGIPLEATDRVLRHFEDYLRDVREITNFVSFTGTASPFRYDFLKKDQQ